MTCHLTRLLPGGRHYEQAKAELEDTRRELVRVQRQWPTVHRIAEAMIRHRRQNHFAESLNVIFRGDQ